MLENEITIVIPLFKAKAYLDRFGELLNTERQLRDFRFMLVNDGGDIQTTNMLIELSIKYNNLDWINLKENVGQHAATALGIQKARTEFVGTLDQDYILQLPEFLPYFNSQPEKGELIYLALQEKKRSFVRKLSSNILLAIMNLFGGFSLPGIYSSRILSQSDAANLNVHPQFILDLELLKQGMKLRVVNTDIPLFEKASSYSFMQLIRNFNIIIVYYTYFYEFVLVGLASLGFLLLSMQIFALVLLLMIILLIKKQGEE